MANATLADGFLSPTNIDFNAFIAAHNDIDSLNKFNNTKRVSSFVHAQQHPTTNLTFHLNNFIVKLLPWID